MLTSDAVPEWKRDVTHRTGTSFHPIAFRAGGGVASLLQGPPRQQWMFLLADSAQLASGSPVNPREAGDRAPLREPSDIVSVSDDGETWYLDPGIGRVTSQDIGGNRAVVASLGTRRTVRTACALGDSTIAFVDSGRPGRIFVHGIGTPSAFRELPFPDGLLTDGGVRWPDLRFGGSPGGPCVLFAPRMRGVVVVTDSSARAIVPFVEPLSPVDRLHASGAWYVRLLGFLRRDPQRIGAMDATSVSGGVAVLFAGGTDDAGRLVDFYDASGAYRITMRLPHRALRIAGTHHRLVVLSERHGEVSLASYLLPARVRSQAPADEPDVIAPVRPAGRDRGPGSTPMP